MSKTKIAWTDNPVLIKRFWNYVDRKSNSECWNWKAGKFKNGYGQFRLLSKKIRAHRLSYSLTFGQIPEHLIIRHTCDNPKCVNPRHLITGTHKQNADDRRDRFRTAYGVTKNKSMPGEKNPAAKLTKADVECILLLIKNGINCKIIAAQYMVCLTTIRNIRDKKTWQQIQR